MGNLCGEDRTEVIQVVRKSMNQWIRQYRDYVFLEPASSATADLMLAGMALAISDSFGEPALQHIALDIIEN